MLLVIFPIFDSPLDHRYPYVEIHRTVGGSAAAELGIPVLDLLTAFTGMDTRRLAVEPFADAHPNELAHRLAAEAILETLIERGMLPTPAPAASGG